MENRPVLKEDLNVIESLVNKYFEGQSIRGVDRMGGMTNHTYCVALSSKRYVFRLPGEGTEKMINRSDEKTSTELACQIDIDAPLIMFDANTGIKIAEYIEDSETMSPETLRHPDNLKLAAEILKALHSCGTDTKVSFDVFGMSEEYEQIIRLHNVPLFDDYENVRKRVFNIRKKLQGRHPLIPCHNDPLCENWIRTKERMYLIDWEYAGMNEGMWDVADVAIEAHMDEKTAELFLEMYLGHKADREEKLDFIANEIYLDFLWTLWGKTRVPFDGDAMEMYAEERYQRLKENMKKFDVYCNS